MPFSPPLMLGGVLCVFVFNLWIGGNLVWGPFWSWVVFVECYWYEYGKCLGRCVIEASLGLFANGFFLCGLGSGEVSDVVLVVIGHDNQVIGVVLVVCGGWVSMFRCCLGGGHMLALFPGDGLNVGEVLALRFSWCLTFLAMVTCLVPSICFLYCSSSSASSASWITFAFLGHTW